MKIATLIENRPSTTDSGLVAEWGLSLHISFNGHTLLFDMGATEAFAMNAERLSIDIGAVGTAILSHHHYDHGGGLRRFFELNTGAKVYLGERPEGDFFGRVWLFGKYVGLDKQVMTDHSNRLAVVREPCEILPDVFLIPHIRCTHPLPAGNKRLFLKTEQGFVHDDFGHEVVLVIKENGKLTVFTGCAHNGVLNMLDTVSAHFAGMPIRAVIGGFHLMTVPFFNYLAEGKYRVRELAKSIMAYPVEAIYTGHCTAIKAFEVLHSVMGDRLVHLSTGSLFEI